MYLVFFVNLDSKNTLASANAVPLVCSTRATTSSLVHLKYPPVADP